MTDNSKVRFFDEIADKWDDWENLDLLATRMGAGLEAFGVRPDEIVLDVGCGTGNLTQALLNKLSADGRVVAIDFSAAMVARARAKIADRRVGWHVADATGLPVADDAVDRAICYSVWPHFDDQRAVLEELRRVLRPAGVLHVWHLSARTTVNDIHASAAAAVSKDLLLPAAETARFLEQHGLSPFEVVDGASQYLVSAVNAVARR